MENFSTINNHYKVTCSDLYQIQVPSGIVMPVGIFQHKIIMPVQINIFLYKFNTLEQNHVRENYFKNSKSHHAMLGRGIEGNNSIMPALVFGTKSNNQKAILLILCSTTLQYTIKLWVYYFFFYCQVINISVSYFIYIYVHKFVFET